MAFAIAVFASSNLMAQARDRITYIALDAADVLPKAMLSGEGYEVDSKVVSDGVQNTYTLRTDYGDYALTGNGALAARIQEVKATKALEEIKGSDAFKDAVKGTASGMVEGGKALVSSPVETTKGAAKGLGRWLGNVGRSVSSSDPYQDNVMKVMAGYDAAKRGYAIELGVDPYTDLEPFAKELSEVAKASTAGGLVMSVGSDAATSGTAVVGTVDTVASTASMKDLLMDEPPSTLAKINRKKLVSMGIDKVVIAALLKNYNYTPTDMTVMVEALNRMGDIKGRDIFVTYAVAAPDKLIVRWIKESAEMLANYISKNETGDIVNIGEEAWFVTDSGKLIGAAPIDYLAWTSLIEDREKLISEAASERGLKGKELWIQGQVEPEAKKLFEQRGWKIKEERGLLNAS